MGYMTLRSTVKKLVSVIVIEITESAAIFTIGDTRERGGSIVDKEHFMNGRMNGGVSGVVWWRELFKLC
jgi:hypothetical protein